MLHFFILFTLTSALGLELEARAKKPLCSQVASKCSGAKASAYCSSYLFSTTVTTTVTSGTSTATVTSAPTCGRQTLTERNAAATLLEKRAVKKPRCLPGSDPSAISSACSCLSLSGPTSTIVSAAETTTVTATGPFAVYITGSPADEEYFQSPDGAFVPFGSEPSEDTFVIDADGNLFDSEGQQAIVSDDNSAPGSLIAFQDPASIPGSSSVPVSCQINNDCSLFCAGNVYNVSGDCSGYWGLARTPTSSNCDIFLPYAVTPINAQN